MLFLVGGAHTRQSQMLLFIFGLYSAFFCSRHPIQLFFLSGHMQHRLVLFYFIHTYVLYVCVAYNNTLYNISIEYIYLSMTFVTACFCHQFPILYILYICLNSCYLCSLIHLVPSPPRIVLR